MCSSKRILNPGERQTGVSLSPEDELLGRGQTVIRLLDPAEAGGRKRIAEYASSGRRRESVLNGECASMVRIARIAPVGRRGGACLSSLEAINVDEVAERLGEGRLSWSSGGSGRCDEGCRCSINLWTVECCGRSVVAVVVDSRVRWGKADT